MQREATDAAVNYAKDAESGDTFRGGSQAIAKRVQDNPLGSMLIASRIGCVGAIADAPAAPSTAAQAISYDGHI
jgi:hypothetical protein